MAAPRVEIDAGRASDADVPQHAAAENAAVIGQRRDIGIEVKRAIGRREALETGFRQLREQQRAIFGIAPAIRFELFGRIERRQRSVLRERRRRGQGQESHVPEQFAGERGPRLQLELRPGEPGYSGPAEEFGEEPDFVAAEEVAEGDLIETVPPKQDAQPHETQPAAERATPLAAAKEAPPAPSAASEAETEAERTPVAYNVSPPHEVSGPAPNPRRGWWRR